MDYTGISDVFIPTPNEQIEKASNEERRYQDAKWGDLEEHPHTVLEWIRIAQNELDEAEEAWMKGTDVDALEEALQAYSVLKACFQQHGFVQRGRKKYGKKKMAVDIDF